MYMTGIGFVMVFYGIIIDQLNDDNSDESYNRLFAGGFLTTFFWVYVTINFTYPYTKGKRTYINT